MRYLALATFLLVYVLFVILPRRRAHVAIAGALFLIVCGVLSPLTAFTAVNWNVIGIFVGTLALAEIFSYSRMPAYLAERLVNAAGRTCWAILFVCGLTSVISAFVENVATVLIIAPIALSLADKLKISPIFPIIAIAVSSNLQGTATLIGDPPSMLLGGFAKMTFNDFFIYHGNPGIFFAVQIGAIASFVVLYFFFRGQGERITLECQERIITWVPTIMLITFIVSLAFSSFIDPEFRFLAGVISMSFGLISLVWYVLAARGDGVKFVRSLDWNTTLFLIGVFIVVDSLTETGWLVVVANGLAALAGNNVLVVFLLIISISTLVSAFVDNVPYLVAMIPVAQLVAADLGVNQPLILFGLLIGSCLGGNITPIGASANIVATGILRRQGYVIPFRTFVKLGLPFTIAAVSSAALFLWLVWRY
jgi:Na+/H+ antiporter NhaD/arsenite permease-like protein